MKKSCLSVCLIIFISFALILGGIAFALSPPFQVCAPVSVPADAEDALSQYLLEQLELALDSYSGEENVFVTVGEAELSQVLANSLATQLPRLPKGFNFSGVIVNVNGDIFQAGAKFKFLFFPLGISAKVKIIEEDDNLRLDLLSTQLGRITLSRNLILNRIGKLTDLPLDSDNLSIPIAFEEEGISLASIQALPGQIVIGLRIKDGLIPEIPSSTLDSFQETLPAMSDILIDNPTAAQALAEIENLLSQAKAQDTKVNPLSLKILGDKLYLSLSQEEISKLDGVLSSEVKDLLEQNMD